MWFTPTRIYCSTLDPYDRFNGAKQLTSSGYKRCDECGGIQRIIILCSLLNRSNLGVWWLPWPSRISSRYTPFVRCAVCLSKTVSSQVSPRISSVHPFSETVITQSRGKSLIYQVDRWTFPSNIITGGRLHPCVFIHSIAVTHSRFPGYKVTGLFVREPVITFAVLITPIWKPVSSKLYMSSVWIPYFSIVFYISRNQSRIRVGSSHFARW